MSCAKRQFCLFHASRFQDFKLWRQNSISWGQTLMHYLKFMSSVATWEYLVKALARNFLAKTEFVLMSIWLIWKILGLLLGTFGRKFGYLLFQRLVTLYMCKQTYCTIVSVLYILNLASMQNFWTQLTFLCELIVFCLEN